MANYGVYPGAYNPYSQMPPFGYQSPYNAPFNNRYTPALTESQPNSQVPQNVQQQASNIPWIQVPNIEAARNVMVQPNHTAYMMNQNAPEFYVKNTDAMGVATLRCFKFAEFNPTEEAAKEVLSSQAGNLVSREEFNNFAQNVAAQFNALQQNMVVNANVSAPAQQVPVNPVVAPIIAPVQPETSIVQTQEQPVVRGSKKKETTT